MNQMVSFRREPSKHIPIFIRRRAIICYSTWILGFPCSFPSLFLESVWIGNSTSSIIIVLHPHVLIPKTVPKATRNNCSAVQTSLGDFL
ncbi:hypothetical protein GALMADRAFT_1105399 [Galerina marginata CBS 339.88]|uniref:Uncharacterized protein n=1 Tax=Galerina marginata (strain CBS 339.88) TaxID=685588 RepID=A0A067TC69_GALM3|nr:hypothetical protein GALMADRAFT_1105399 [Galerina marginata CBS 339.88]